MTATPSLAGYAVRVHSMPSNILGNLICLGLTVLLATRYMRENVSRLGEVMGPPLTISILRVRYIPGFYVRYCPCWRMVAAYI